MKIMIYIIKEFFFFIFIQLSVCIMWYNYHIENW
jgi:hypothetical protein